MTILPANSGVTAVSDITHQLVVDLPDLLLMLAGVIAVMSVMRILHRWLFDNTPGHAGNQPGNPFASSDPGGRTKWREFERSNEKAIRDADSAIAENRRLLRRL